MRRQLRILCAVLVLGSVCASTAPALACPMCKFALDNQQDAAAAARPKAYMYSILFMLSMPATLFTGFSVVYRLSKQQQLLNAQIAAEYGERTDGTSA